MRTGWIIGVAVVLAIACARAQQSRPTTTDRNGAANRATHRPDQVLRPLLAWEYVKQCHARAVANRKARSQAGSAPADGQHGGAHGHPVPHGEGRHADAGTHENEPIPRPAFAGRYVCAVFVCSGCEQDVVELLGMRRRDVLVVQTPGPFVQPDTVALIERTVRRHRLSLVLVLGHERCSALQPRGEDEPEDALSRRAAALRARAALRRQAVPLAMVHRQRELLLASSRLLAERQQHDELRIMPGVLDDRRGTIRWLTRNANRMAIRPVDGKDSRK